MRKKTVPAVAVFSVIAVIICLFGGYFLYQRYSPSKELADLNQVYGVSGNEAALVMNGRTAEKKGVVSDGAVYIELDTARDLFHSGLYWDRQSGQLLYTNAVTTYSSPMDGNVYTEPESGEHTMEHVICYEEAGQLYVLADYLALFTDMDCVYYENPSRLVVSMGQEEMTRAVTKEEAVIRRLGGIKSEIIAAVPAGTSVTVLYEMDNWSEVCTDDGYTGYMQNRELEGYTQTVRESDFSEPEYTNISYDQPVCMVWHQVFAQSDNDAMEELIGRTQGVNVISPTWFALRDNEGNFDSLADASYVERAHAMGLEVWVLINDFHRDMSIQQVLSTKTSRDHLRESLVQEVKNLGADGINIDFEYITAECADDFIQFLRELSVDCRREGLVLSADNYMPTEGNAFYDLETQGKIMDYVILMGYDEHWEGSKAGSSASISFVERGIARALESVAAEKLIGGVPFFTRVWTETPEELADSGAQIREDGNSVYSRYALSSEACGMAQARQLLEKHGVTPEWDVELGQYYGEYDTEQGKVRIWLEDAKSLEEKLRVISQNQLAGVAGWKLGLETEDVWPVINENLTGGS